MRRDVLGVKLHVQVEGLVLHIAKIGIGARIGNQNSDLDRLGLYRRRQHCAKHGTENNAPQPHHGPHGIPLNVLEWTGTIAGKRR